MFLAAKARGFNPRVASSNFSGEARELAKEILAELHDSASRTALLYGGESTVTIRGSGQGGRNQELVLAGLADVRLGEFLSSFASDGRDNTDFAGALCDTITKDKARQMRLKPEEYLKENDAYNFWKPVGDYLLTGDTGSNVSDIILAIKDG